MKRRLSPVPSCLVSSGNKKETSSLLSRLPQQPRWLSQRTRLMSHRLPARRPHSRQVRMGPRSLPPSGALGRCRSCLFHLSKHLEAFSAAQLCHLSKGSLRTDKVSLLFPRNRHSTELKERESVVLSGSSHEGQLVPSPASFYSNPLTTTGVVWTC